MRDTPRKPFGTTAPSLLLALGLLACHGGEAPPPGNPVPKGPSVLLITLDTTRADRLGCYGANAGITPSLDRFARGASRFLRCEAAVPLTLPSHTTLLSGLVPARHSVRVNEGIAVPREVPLVAEAFSAAGYDTAAFVSSSVLLRRCGLDRGFALYDDSFYDPVTHLPLKGRAAQTLDSAAAWIGSRQRPFFAWVHLFDPHFPYEPPEPFDRRFPGEPYDGEVAYMDAQLGAFFDRLEPLSPDRWVWVICADHGEALGDHGERHHGTLLYESTMRVPLLVRPPGGGSPPEVPDLVGLVDVGPTLLNLAGLEVPKGLDGRTLAPLLQGVPLPPRPVAMESLNGALTYGWSPLFGATEGTLKYIEAPRPELYDLEPDPGETRNLLPLSPPKLVGLREVVEEYRGLRPLGLSKGRPNTPEELRTLASLGYLSASFGEVPRGGRDPKELVHLEGDFIRAAVLVARGERDEALGLLDSLEKEDRANPHLAFLRGQALAPVDQEGAEKAFGRAVRLSPSYTMAWTEWVGLRMGRGDTSGAAALGRLALQSSPDGYGRYNLALGEEAFVRGQGEAEVLSHVDTALAADPSLARAYLLKGVTLLRAGRTAEAEVAMEKVWTLASRAEVESWSNSPAFKEVFAARPKS